MATPPIPGVAPTGPPGRGSSRTLDWAWQLLLVGFALSVAIFALAGSWGVVAFSVGWCGGFGGLFYLGRRRFAALVPRLRFDRWPGFVVLCVAVTCTEESFAWATGARLAQPILWVDLIWVCAGWTVWLLAWRQYLARQFTFSEKEALLAGGLVGVLFEQAGAGLFLRAPLEALILVPVETIVYSSIFLLP
ncbi:MAG: hypothetical protein L3K09_04635, partial [Thermoplasmata archaeon]|nr:hypothetical protein [Thermoplasmata archaeon]